VGGDELTLRLPHLELAARAWGGAGDTRVIALHGWLDNASTFDRLAPMLEGARVVALDLPGHGRSDRLPGGCGHHFVDWVPVVIAATDALGWDQFCVMGHSMGAGIASLVPSVIPDRVQRLILLEGFGPLSDAPENAPAALAAALEQEARLADVEPRAFASMTAAVEARRRNSDLDRDSVSLLVERGTELVADGVRFTHDPRLRTRSRSRLTEEQALAFLGAIACPVLAVRASAGWPFPAEIVAHRMATVADLRLVEVEGGHHVHLTHPERVAPHVNDFLG